MCIVYLVFLIGLVIIGIEKPIQMAKTTTINYYSSHNQCLIQEQTSKRSLVVL